MEYIDIYDVNRRFLNKTVPRNEKLNIGEYRLAVSVMIINSKNEILTTLRSPVKKSYPNKWENTTGGVVSGEDMRTAAVREVFEEIGIIIEKSELIKLEEFISGDLLFDTFVVFKDIIIEEIVLDEEETVDIKIVSIEEFDKMVDSDMVLKPQADAYKSKLRELLLKEIDKTKN